VRVGATHPASANIRPMAVAKTAVLLAHI
jgi:hypothetical protein